MCYFVKCKVIPCIVVIHIRNSIGIQQWVKMCGVYVDTINDIECRWGLWRVVRVVREAKHRIGTIFNRKCHFYGIFSHKEAYIRIGWEQKSASASGASSTTNRWKYCGDINGSSGRYEYIIYDNVYSTTKCIS